MADQGLAVHFGAGNIGRGFVGLLLHRAGYEVVFADVMDDLIDALATSSSYTVHAVGTEGYDETVDNYRALNSKTHEVDVIAAVAQADIVTTAVGPNVLKFIAPVILAALRQRNSDCSAGGDGLRERHQRHRCAGPRDARRCVRGRVGRVRQPRGVRQHGGGSHRAGPGRRCRSRRHRRDVLRVGDRDLAVHRLEGRYAAEHSRTRPGWTISRRTSSASCSRSTPGTRARPTTGSSGASTSSATHSEDAEVRAAVEGVLAETKQLLVAKHDFEPGRPAGLPGEDPRPVREPAPAGHRRPGRSAAAAQAVPQRTADRARRRTRRARHPAGLPARHGRCRAPLRRPRRPGERSG